jgi:hypothetical protein
MSEIQAADDNNSTASSELLKYDFRGADIKKKNARRHNKSYQGSSNSTLDDISPFYNLGDRNIS